MRRFGEMAAGDTILTGTRLCGSGQLRSSGPSARVRVTSRKLAMPPARGHTVWIVSLGAVGRGGWGTRVKRGLARIADDRCGLQAAALEHPALLGRQVRLHKVGNSATLRLVAAQPAVHELLRAALVGANHQGLQ